MRLELMKNEMIVGVTGEYALRRIRNQCGRKFLIRLIPERKSQYADTSYFIVRRADAAGLVGKKDIRECDNLHPSMFASCEDETKMSRSGNHLQQSLFD